MQCFKKTPTEEDWAHLEHLAAYVQEFDGIDNQKIGLGLDNGILQALRSRYSDRGIHIFPRLRVLSCRGCEQLQCVNFLLHPELRTLRITFWRETCAFCVPASGGDEPQLPVLNCLKHIHFSAPNAPLVLYAPISKFLFAHATNKLKSVHVDGIPIPSEVVKTILECEALEEITLKVTSPDMEDLFEIDMTRPNLKKFHMELEPPVGWVEISRRLKDSFYTELITKLRAPNLVAFQFSGGSQFPYASDIKCLLEMILGREHSSDENQARTIRLIPQLPGYMELAADPQPRICTFANALHALTLPLPSDRARSSPSGLEVLDLDEVFVDLSDKEFGILTASLPHLKSLIFSARAYGQGKSRTTLIGLWLLAKHCKSLENLGLLIDATIDWEAFRTLTGFDGDHDSVEARVEHYTLARNVNVHNIYLGESTVGEESIAKEFLGMVFPVILNLFYARSREETDEMTKWRAIKHSLSAPTSN
jgi:hypothetical protein